MFHVEQFFFMYVDTISFTYPYCDNFKKILNCSELYGMATVFKSINTRVSLDFICDEITGEIIEPENSGEYVKSRKNMYKFTPSSSNEINITHVLADNSLSFEFSIPKYLCGHNINLYPDPKYQTDNKARDLYLFLKSFIAEFFRTNFNLTYKKELLIINRIDLCFNYKFLTYERLEQYIQVLKNNWVGKAGRYRAFGEDQTFMVITDSYSFKFYKKYDEFLKTSEASLRRKLSKQYNYEFANSYVESLCFYSRNILRSEITLRPRKMIDLIYSDLRHYNLSSYYKKRVENEKQKYLKVENQIRRVLAIRDQIRISSTSDLSFLLAQIDVSYFKLHISLDIEKFIRNDKHDLTEKIILSDYLSEIYARQWRSYKKLLRIKPILLDYSKTRIDYEYKVTEPNYYVINDNFLGIVYKTFEKLVYRVIPKESGFIDIKDYLVKYREQIKAETGLTVTPLLNHLQKVSYLGANQYKELARSTYDRNEKNLKILKEKYQLIENRFKLAEYFDLNQKFINFNYEHK